MPPRCKKFTVGELSHAAKTGDLEAVKRLLPLCQSCQDLADHGSDGANYFGTALMIAAGQGHRDIVNLIWKRYEQLGLSCQDRKDLLQERSHSMQQQGGRTLLHHAATCPDIATFLLVLQVYQQHFYWDFLKDLLVQDITISNVHDKLKSFFTSFTLEPCAKKRRTMIEGRSTRRGERAAKRAKTADDDIKLEPPEVVNTSNHDQGPPPTATENQDLPEPEVNSNNDHQEPPAATAANQDPATPTNQDEELSNSGAPTITTTPADDANDEESRDIGATAAVDNSEDPDEPSAVAPDSVPSAADGPSNQTTTTNNSGGNDASDDGNLMRACIMSNMHSLLHLLQSKTGKDMQKCQIEEVMDLLREHDSDWQHRFRMMVEVVLWDLLGTLQNDGRNCISLVEASLVSMGCNLET